MLTRTTDVTAFGRNMRRFLDGLEKVCLDLRTWKKKRCQTFADCFAGAELGLNSHGRVVVETMRGLPWTPLRIGGCLLVEGKKRRGICLFLRNEWMTWSMIRIILRLKVEGICGKQGSLRLFLLS
jgi:hypothetical protein